MNQESPSLCQNAARTAATSKCNAIKEQATAGVSMRTASQYLAPQFSTHSLPAAFSFKQDGFVVGREGRESEGRRRECGTDGGR